MNSSLEIDTFKSVFDIIPFPIYVMDVDSYEVVFTNRYFREINGDVAQEPCWKAVYGNDRKCLHCKAPHFAQTEQDQQNTEFIFEFFNEKNETWYQLQEKSLKWPDGRRVKVSIAVNIAQIKEMQNSLAESHANLTLTHRELEKVAVTDSLTGLKNRYKINDVLAMETERARRYEQPFSIVLCDLDNFKGVNDQFGHLAGDTVLREFADLLSKTFRAIDSVGRWGGEEFIVVCGNTDLDEAEQLGERLRALVEAHKFDVVNKVTCSLGVATLRADETAHDCLKRADDALYRAKAAGRNSVVTEDR